MSLPRTVMRPESDLSSPRANLRRTLLPAPATPNSAFVSPKGSRKETPRNTSFSSKDRWTSSNTMANPECSCVVAKRVSRGKAGADIGLAVRQQIHWRWVTKKMLSGSFCTLCRGCIVDSVQHQDVPRTNIRNRVTNTSTAIIKIIAATTDSVVARPTPCVPPFVDKP